MGLQNLSEKEKMFAAVYVKTMCPQTAALESGYSISTARTRAYQWIGDREVKPWLYDHIQALLEAKRGRFTITTQQVLHRLWLIATADPNELMELRRVNCRYCHGDGFGYQWREREYLKAVRSAERTREELPDYAGGFGYDDNRDPNPACPDCGGLGEERVIPKDTRDLTPAGRALFAGLERTQNGLKPRTHNQLDALRDIGKHLGMFIDRKELFGPGGTPLVPTPLVEGMSAQDAAKAYAEMVKAGA